MDKQGEEVVLCRKKHVALQQNGNHLPVLANLSFHSECLLHSDPLHIYVAAAVSLGGRHLLLQQGHLEVYLHQTKKYMVLYPCFLVFW